MGGRVPPQVREALLGLEPHLPALPVPLELLQQVRPASHLPRTFMAPCLMRPVEGSRGPRAPGLANPSSLSVGAVWLELGVHAVQTAPLDGSAVCLVSGGAGPTPKKLPPPSSAGPRGVP